MASTIPADNVNGDVICRRRSAWTGRFLVLLFGVSILRVSVLDNMERMELRLLPASSSLQKQEKPPGVVMLHNKEEELVLSSRPSSNVTESDGVFSACLLTMDDNHFLIEWLAYHYHTLPLRRLIVAVDPNSRTSPSTIFDRWRTRGLMKIDEWTDFDFMTNDDVKQLIPILNNGKSNGTNMHRLRQKAFYKSCLGRLHQEKRTWTLLIDTDEYLSVNTFTRSLNVDVENPASLMTFLKREILGRNETPACIMIPRLLFGSLESENLLVSKLVPAGLNGSDFQTLRFRKHGPTTSLHGLAKTIIDVSRVDARHITMGSPHESRHRSRRNLSALIFDGIRS